MLQVHVERTVQVHYQTSDWSPREEVPRAVHVACHALYKAGLKVSAIKYAREQLKLGLKEAKDLCDNLALIAVE